MPRIIPVDYRTHIRVFEPDGFAISRQKADHVVMTKPGIPRPVVIKTSPRKVPVTHICISLATAGIPRERYFQLLDQAG